MTTPSKYKPEYCQLLIDIFKEGKSIAGFCAQVNVAQETFQNWLAVHQELRDSYEIAKVHAQDWWENFAIRCMQDGVSVGPTWGIMMRNRFDYTDVRKVRLAGLKAEAKAKENANLVLDSIGKEELTTKEACDLMEVVKDLVTIDEATNQAERLGALEEVLYGKKTT